MNASIYKVALLVMIMTGLSLRGFSQQAIPNQEKQQRNYYRRVLGVDSLKAIQVQRIQENYKQALKGLMADTSLTAVVKRQRMLVLMDIKNVQLRTLLTPSQQQKVIPSTERMPSQQEK